MLMTYWVPGRKTLWWSQSNVASQLNVLSSLGTYQVIINPLKFPSALTKSHHFINEAKHLLL